MKKEDLIGIDRMSIEYNKNKSSMISSISFVPRKTKGTLTITFSTNDSTYTYYNVEIDVFLDFINSESIGSYFTKNIKGLYNTDIIGDKNE